MKPTLANATTEQLKRIVVTEGFTAYYKALVWTELDRRKTNAKT